MTAVPGDSAWLPAPHGGRLAERLVPADRAEALAAQLLADSYRARGG